MPPFGPEPANPALDIAFAKLLNGDGFASVKKINKNCFS